MRWRSVVLPGLLAMALWVPSTRAQTFNVVLTEAGEHGKDARVLGQGTLHLDKRAPALRYTIQFRSDIFYGQLVAICAGSVKKPGPPIFVLSGPASQSPIEGSLVPSLLIPAPDFGVRTWEDAITALWTGKTILTMKTPHYAGGVCGRLRLVRH